MQAQAQASPLERLQFTIDRRLPYVEQLVAQIANLVHIGLLLPGERLSNVDRWAAHVDISMRTASATFKILLEWGVTTFSNRGGTHVAQDGAASARRLLYALRLQALNSWATSIGATDEDLHAVFLRVAAVERPAESSEASGETAKSDEPKSP